MELPILPRPLVRKAQAQLNNGMGTSEQTNLLDKNEEHSSPCLTIH